MESVYYSEINGLKELAERKLSNTKQEVSSRNYVLAHMMLPEEMDGLTVTLGSRTFRSQMGTGITMTNAIMQHKVAKIGQTSPKGIIELI